MKYIAYTKCKCGAITITVDGSAYSCDRKTIKKFFPGLDLRKLNRYPDTYCCNHCINHYGLDLCGCGSGEPFGRCGNDFDECKKPMQILGEYTRVIAKDAIGV